MRRLTTILADTYAPLGRPAFRRYWLSQAVSLLGTAMQTTAQSWLVWRLTHRPAALGTFAMLSLLPILVLGPVGGVVADRIDRRRWLLVTQGVSLGIALVLGVLVATGAVRLWHVYGLGTLLGCCVALETPALQAFIGDLAGAADVRRAVTLNSTIVQTARMLGPAIGGWLLAHVDIAPVYALNALSYVVVLSALRTVRAPSAGVPAAAARAHPLAEAREGARTLWGHPRYRDLVALCIVVTCFGAANHQMLPAIASDVLHGGPALLGRLLGATGAGSLVGVLLLTPLCQRIRRTGWVLLAAVALSGIGYTVLSLSRHAWLSTGALFVATLTYPIVSTTASTFFQTSAPAALRARVLSAWMTVTLGLAPFATLLLGAGSQRWGAAAMIRANGLVMLAAVAVLAAVRPGLRAWSAWAPTGAPASGVAEPDAAGPADVVPAAA